MRTIDADTLRERLQSLADDDCNQGVITYIADAYHEIIDVVEKQPTIEPKQNADCAGCKLLKEMYGSDADDEGDEQNE